MKRILFVMLFALTSLMAYAQEMKLGVKLGANFSEFDKAKNMSMSSKTGFHMGAYATLPLGRFALQPEFLYSQQGAKLNGSEIDLDYVNIPVLAKFHILPKVNLHVGPQFGFVVKDGLKDIYPDFKAEKFDISGLLGIGIEVFGFQLEGRYNYGLSKVIKSDSSIQAIDPKNQMFSVSLGIPLL